MPQRSKGGRFPKSEMGKGYFAKQTLNDEAGTAASCSGKFRFNSYDAAAKSIRRVGGGGKQRGRLGPYHCGICGLYHVGTRIP